MRLKRLRLQRRWYQTLRSLVIPISLFAANSDTTPDTVDDALIDCEASKKATSALTLWFAILTNDPAVASH
ncbi:hypothetical protein HYPSUDRAFT_49127 [Hypholoma sublateritium FD-334 SS-4]|uniref:Uncharacterized protein n=1 Tax=Hypholoma sublateritium (strain FD-334 SS-4) TaxID=945553 RepID=A0A0D2P1I1_HYPSF|nr:hypothetical protein HYPSUDRAFT_49127 [Hypholoma sublateritium FD-334 SS-4]